MIRIPGPPVRALHVLVLFCFALAQPLFELMARQGEFLIAHRANRGDVLLIAVAISGVAPGVVILAKGVIERLIPSAVAGLHLGTTAVLAGAIALPPMTAFEEVLHDEAMKLLESLPETRTQIPPFRR